MASKVKFKDEHRKLSKAEYEAIFKTLSNSLLGKILCVVKHAFCGLDMDLTETP
jgi:hypothetical protein